MTLDPAAAALAPFPRRPFVNAPTPVERLGNLSARLGAEISVKRDDYTGATFGGNKVRQLEFYFGAAMAAEADTILITGAVQSNFARTAASLARHCGMDCHIQLEERAPGVGPLYRENGNVALDRLLGATLHSYPVGEDEAGADAALGDIAATLRAKGRRPYIIPLSGASPPTGALGYIAAAAELHAQGFAEGAFDAIVIASGSALTHVGLLYGLRLLGDRTPVHGVCVRRAAGQQGPRVLQRARDLAAMIGQDCPVTAADVTVHDMALAPGYGQVGPMTVAAIRAMAEAEGIFLDPVYTGKTMAGLIALTEAGPLRGKRVLFWHTGGLPALFAYADQLS